MTKHVRELPVVKQTNPKEQYQQEVRQEAFRTLDALGLTTNKSVVKKTDTLHFLAAQKFPLGAFSGDDIRINSTGGSEITAKTDFSSGNHVVSNVDFTKGITLQDNAIVAFNGCRIQDVVTVADGGKAVFAGCVFEDDGYVNNAGPAANVGIVGCIKTSSTLHVNATDIFSV